MRKCDDCGKNWATESVGGRKVCSDCGQSARERKRGCEEEDEPFEDRESFEHRYGQ